MWDFIRNHASQYARLAALILSGFGIGLTSTDKITGTKISVDLDDLRFVFDDLLSTNLENFSPNQSLALAGSISLLDRKHPLARELVRKSWHRESFFAHERVDVIIRQSDDSRPLAGKLAAACVSSTLSGMRVAIYSKDGGQRLQPEEIYVTGQPHGQCTVDGTTIIWVNQATWDNLMIENSSSESEVIATGIILSAI